jgi:CRP-like cAMP-binding protein
MSVTKMLKGHELFRSLGFDEIERISSYSELRQLDGGDKVFDAGSSGSRFFVLLEGRVSLRLPAESHEPGLVVGRIAKGEIFGLAPLLGAGGHTTTAECAEPCTVLGIDAPSLRKLLEQNCPVGFQIMNVAAQVYFSRYTEILNRLQKVVHELAVI